MSDAVIIAIGSGFLSLIGIIINGLVAYFIARINNKVAVQDTKLDQIHSLTNTNYGLQLRLNADNAEWRASRSKKLVDKKAAFEAKNLLNQYENGLTRSRKI